jgi:uncharacterized protein (DUF1778 family)
MYRGRIELMTETATKSPRAKVMARAVNLRVREDIRSLIDRAARAHDKTRSDFMIDAARRAAEEALLDLTLVRVDPETYARFLDVLDNPPTGDGYRRLMASPKPWST